MIYKYYIQILSRVSGFQMIIFQYIHHLESCTPGLWRYVPVHTGMYCHVLFKFYSTRRYILGLLVCLIQYG
jgi:hypothetical protein